jgi:hypothetical protein
MKGKESPENVNEGEGENKADNFIGDKGSPIQMTDLSSAPQGGRRREQTRYTVDFILNL